MTVHANSRLTLQSWFKQTRRKLHSRIQNDPYEIMFSLMDTHRNVYKKKAMTRKAAIELNAKLADTGFTWMPGG